MQKIMRYQWLIGLMLSIISLFSPSAFAENPITFTPPAIDDNLLIPPALENTDHSPISNSTENNKTIHLSASTTIKNPINILQELTQRAQAGDIACQFSLGYMYANGKGMQQNDQEAVYWYRRSAQGGYAKGLIAMAEAFDLGRGVKQNHIAAYVLAKAAADKKHQITPIATQFKAKLSVDELAKANQLSVTEVLTFK